MKVNRPKNEYQDLRERDPGSSFGAQAAASASRTAPLAPASEPLNQYHHTKEEDDDEEKKRKKEKKKKEKQKQKKKKRRTKKKRWKKKTGAGPS